MTVRVVYLYAMSFPVVIIYSIAARLQQVGLVLAFEDIICKSSQASCDRKSNNSKFEFSGTAVESQWESALFFAQATCDI